jgi:hypothetical protein
MKWIKSLLGISTSGTIAERLEKRAVRVLIQVNWKVTLFNPSGEALEVFMVEDEPYCDDGGSLNFYTKNGKEVWFHGMWKFEEL